MAESPQPSPIAEISNEQTGLERFLDRNQALVIILGVVVVLGLAGWIVMRGLKEGADTSGGAALVAAEDLEALQEVREEHASSPAATSAALLVSDRQWEQGQQDAAVETLREVIDTAPDHPAAVPAMARLGGRLRQQGKIEEAREAFAKVLASPDATYLAPYALGSLAGIARAEGDLDRARELLEQARQQFPDNPLSVELEEALTYLDFEMPAEVEPAPEPEAPSEAPDPDSPSELEFPSFTPGSGTSDNPLLQDLDPGSAPTPPEDHAPTPPEDPAPAPPEDPAPSESESPAPAEESGE